MSVNGGREHREEGMPTFESRRSWTPAQNEIYFVDGPPFHLSVNYFNFAAWHVDKILELHGVNVVCCRIAVSRNNEPGIRHSHPKRLLV